MIRKIPLLVGIGFGMVLGSVSCDKPAEVDDSTASGPSNARSKRVERPSLKSQGTRGRLRVALDAAMDLEDPEERELAILEVGREAVEAAPDLAAEAIRELRAGSPEARALIYACVTHLMERSPDEALAWAESLEDEALITLARVPIVTVIAQAEPERAIQVLAASNQAAGDWSPELERVLQVWSGRAPADAAAWVTKLPAGESRDAGLKTVVSQWVQADAAASTAWVASLPDSKIRQQSTQAMAESFQGMPSFIRDTILDRADPEIRNEIEYEIEQMEASEETEAEPSGE